MNYSKEKEIIYNAKQTIKEVKKKLKKINYKKINKGVIND